MDMQQSCRAAQPQRRLEARGRGEAPALLVTPYTGRCPPPHPPKIHSQATPDRQERDTQTIPHPPLLGSLLFLRVLFDSAVVVDSILKDPLALDAYIGQFFYVGRREEKGGGGGARSAPAAQRPGSGP